MVRTKRSQPKVEEPLARNSPRKRARDEPKEEGTPSKGSNGKRVAGNRTNGNSNGNGDAYDFPSDDDALKHSTMDERPKKRGRPPKTTTPTQGFSTPSGRKRKIDVTVTPSRNNATVIGETPRHRRNDRSARKKSARALIEQVVGGGASDDGADEDIAREIYNSSEEEEEAEEDEQAEADETTDGLPDEAATPSKRPRGRPKNSQGKQARKKSPTPPRDLPPHELYFAQNRPGAAKTSNNTLASLDLLTHEEYFSILREHKDPHQEDIDFLQSIHVQSFPQWSFELSQGYSICAYGYGSKRALLHKFAKHIYDGFPDHQNHKIVIVNGYVKTSSLREILVTVTSTIDPAHKLPSGGASAMLDSVKSLLSSHNIIITIILNSVDAPPMRKPGIQPILSQLAAHPQIQLVCSADTADFVMLWDSGLRSSFSFTFHDCTTFAPFSAELDVVDDVHELLGRKARRVGGKEGVTYVLRSLPENAKNLFRLLVGEVLVLMDDHDSAGENPGVEYRMLYSKASEEFICSSEMAFRTLLKEYVFIYSCCCWLLTLD
ncbi:origin recognition complex subunit 2-domain-containing protein [Xylariaceae sp. FL0016]|nr:origin recognition complex subunit 2-domain-containing protein [Xylariaceae sp. FL0016]